MLSPCPRWISEPDRIKDCPPNCFIPTSKETLVLVEGLSKIIATILPFKGRGLIAFSIEVGLIPFFDFIACETMSVNSLRDNSFKFRKSGINSSFF